MKNSGYILTIILIAVFGFVISDYAEPTTDFNYFNRADIVEAIESYKYLPVKDTVYVLGDNYIELSLKEQTATIVFRNDTSITFNISSGNELIAKGLSTPTGIYTVQSKSPIAISKQFENCELFNWVGFNGNIGFHGLKGKGYYGHLGKRPSSHGCVRISNEDGEILYKKVTRGTPVLVYNEEPARILAFAEFKNYRVNRDIILDNSDKFTQKMMKKRLKNLTKGNAYINSKYKIFLDGRTIIKPGGFEVANIDMINPKQETPIPSILRIKFEADKFADYNTFRAIKVDSTSSQIVFD